MVAFKRVLKAFPHDYKPAPTYGDAFSHKWGLAYSQFCFALLLLKNVLKIET